MNTQIIHSFSVLYGSRLAPVLYGPRLAPANCLETIIIVYNRCQEKHDCYVTAYKKIKLEQCSPPFSTCGTPTAALKVQGYVTTGWSPDQYYKQTVQKRRAFQELTLQQIVNKLI